MAVPWRHRLPFVLEVVCRVVPGGCFCGPPPGVPGPGGTRIAVIVRERSDILDFSGGIAHSTRQPHRGLCSTPRARRWGGCLSETAVVWLGGDAAALPAAPRASPSHSRLSRAWGAGCSPAARRTHLGGGAPPSVLRLGTGRAGVWPRQPRTAGPGQVVAVDRGRTPWEGGVAHGVDTVESSAASSFSSTAPPLPCPSAGRLSPRLRVAERPGPLRRFSRAQLPSSVKASGAVGSGLS